MRGMQYKLPYTYYTTDSDTKHNTIRAEPKALVDYWSTAYHNVSGTYLYFVSL